MSGGGDGAGVERTMGGERLRLKIQKKTVIDILNEDTYSVHKDKAAREVTVLKSGFTEILGFCLFFVSLSHLHFLRIFL